ncbi:MAG: TetR/AcrR family transcriptional regulator [Gemmatimonadaceae bacterium]|nr:TetR/AcrR family transcriptional regulator [Gemmatimonadaceae bacterium]
MNESSPVVTPRSPRQERGRKRMDEILDAAEQLFMEVGMATSSIQEIAKRAGSSVGSIYHFFPTKDAIIAALRARHEEEGKVVRVAIRAAVESGAHLPLKEFVDRLMSPLADFVEQRPAAFVLGAADGPSAQHKHAKDDPTLDDAMRSALRVRDPHVSADALERRLKVFKTIGGGVAELMLVADAAERREYVGEMKRAVYGYLLTHEPS